MKRNFILLAAVTALAFLAVVTMSPEFQATKTAQKRPLLPDMAKKINDVDKVAIITAGNHTVATIVKSDDGWQLEQMDNYRANWPQLKTLLADLATAKVIETKTDKPKYYARLGVEDVSTKGAKSVMVRLMAGDLKKDVIIGHKSKGEEGQYVRLEGQASSVLVDKQFNVPAETRAWADKRIIDIDAADVAEVEIIHPGGDRILVTKNSASDTDFKLADVPAGREIKSKWAVNSLASVLSLLDLESVRPAADVDWKNAVKLRVLLFSGVEILADVTESDGVYLLRLQATQPQLAVAAKAAGAEKRTGAKQAGGNAQDNDTAPADKKAPDDAAAKAAKAAQQRVEEINQRVKGWAYAISKYKYDAMVKKKEDLLKQPKSKSKSKSK